MEVRIRIKGHLDPTWQSWFAPLQIDHEAAGTTLLSGSLPDQAALYGVLLKIHRLGLTLIGLETGETMNNASTQRRTDMNKVTSKDGTTIAYEHNGEGPPLIIVDGALCSRCDHVVAGIDASV